MSSAAQIAANQANARHSTGPVTESGKSASSRNATKHGLTGKQIVIPGEDPAEYDALRTNLHDSYEPVNEAERILVDQIAAGAWRLQRAQKLEAAALSSLAGKNGLAATFLDAPETLLRLQRYLASFERAYYRAIKELQILQKARTKKQEEVAKQQPNPVVMTWAAELADGFVSSSQSTEPLDSPSQPPESLKKAA